MTCSEGESLVTWKHSQGTPAFLASFVTTARNAFANSSGFPSSPRALPIPAATLDASMTYRPVTRAPRDFASWIPLLMARSDSSEPSVGRNMCWYTMHPRWMNRAPTRGSISAHRVEMPHHALGVGLDAGEQAKRADRLEDRHAAAIKSSAPLAARDAQEFGLEREVDDLRDPMPGLEQLRRQRQAGEFGHAGRRRVDQTVGCGHRGREIGARDRPPLPEVRRKVSGKLRGPFALPVEQGELLGAEHERRVRHGRAGATRAELHDAVELHAL